MNVQCCGCSAVPAAALMSGRKRGRRHGKERARDGGWQVVLLGDDGGRRMGRKGGGGTRMTKRV